MRALALTSAVGRVLLDRMPANVAALLAEDEEGTQSPVTKFLNNPDFWAPLNDLGAGAVNTTLSRGTGVATFTRATAAWTKLASGLWAQVASGTARSCYLGADTTVGAYGGYLAEQASTNLCLQSRDMSNASWTKTNVTAAKDQVGIDGAANSASSLLATGANGTCLQTITQAATSATYSPFIKRLVGTGQIIIQQGATTLDVTALINSTTFTRVPLNASVLNPSIGIKIVTSGDQIAVDMNQFENLAFATSPIPTTTVAVTRNVDVLSYPTSGNFLDATGTAYCEMAGVSGAVQVDVISVRGAGATGGVPLLWTGNSPAKLQLFDGTAFRDAGQTLAVPSTAVNKIASVWGGSASNTALNGTLGTAQTFDGSMNGEGAIGIGANPGGAATAVTATIRNAKIWKGAASDAALPRATT